MLRPGTPCQSWRRKSSPNRKNYARSKNNCASCKPSKSGARWSMHSCRQSWPQPKRSKGRNNSRQRQLQSSSPDLAPSKQGRPPPLSP